MSEKLQKLVKQLGFPMDRGTLAALSVFVAFVASLGGVVWLATRGENQLSPALVAPAQMILGSAVFLTGVTAIVSVFARLGIYDRKSALALPDGSVRALLALVLLVIFVIFANVIFADLSETSRSKTPFDNLTATEIELLPGPVASKQPDGERDGETTFRGAYLEAPGSGEEAAQLGQQIVTGLLTLVATISAFYFGTGSVNAAANAITRTTHGHRGLQVLRPSQPVSLTRKDGELEPMEITLGGPALHTAGVRATITGDDTGTIRSQGAGDVFKYAPGTPAAPVTLTFTSLDDPSMKTELVVDVPPVIDPTEVAVEAAERTVRRPRSRPGG